MSSTVEVKRKTVQDRELISFTKEYAGEEHEVMFPVNQGVQVLATLVDAVNQDLDRGREFVLMRRESVGMIDAEPESTQNELKAGVLRSVVETLYDGDAADKVTAALNGGENES